MFPIPRVIEKRPSAIYMRWPDGHESLYSIFELRDACPCAGCTSEFTGEKILDRNSIPKDVDVIDWQIQGRYAVRFNFNDGHNTGLFTYEWLKKSCPCEACKAQRSALPGG